MFYIVNLFVLFLTDLIFVPLSDPLISQYSFQLASNDVCYIIELHLVFKLIFKLYIEYTYLPNNISTLNE